MIIRTRLLGKRTVAMALWPFILVNRDRPIGQETINHERIHHRQQVEMLVIGFYLWYLIEWLIRLIQYRDSRKAYRNISFEREAYWEETNVHYLSHRKPFAWVKYLKK